MAARDRSRGDGRCAVTGPWDLRGGAGEEGGPEVECRRPWRLGLILWLAQELAP